MRIQNTTAGNITLNYRTGRSVVVPAGQYVIRDSSEIDYLDDTAVTLAMFSSGSLVLSNDDGSAWTGPALPSSPKTPTAAQPVMATLSDQGIRKPRVQLIGPTGADEAGLSSLFAAFRNAALNNPRRNSIATSSATFGANPVAGQIGYANSGISTTGYQSFSITSSSAPSPFIIFGGNPYYAGVPVQGKSYDSATGVRQPAVWRAVVITNAPEPVFQIKGSSNTYPVVVDGKRCSVAVPAAAGGGYQDLSINLRGLTPGDHTVEILMQQDDFLGGVKIPHGYMAYPPAPRPVIAVFTDSLGSTVLDDVTPGAFAGSYDSFAQVMGDYLGADVRVFSAGSTGYQAAGSREKFVDRIPLAAVQLANAKVYPAAVVFAGGINDSSLPDLSADVQRTVSVARSTWPLSPVVVLGSWAGATALSQANCTANEVQILSGALAAGAYFVPVMTDPLGPWISGTGNANAPTGVGTADQLFQSGDATHWRRAGHAAIGARAAIGIVNSLSI